MYRIALLIAALAALPIASPAAEVSGSFSVGEQKLEPTHATAMRIRDQSAPRQFHTFVILTEQPVDAAAAITDIDPYASIINDPGLSDSGAIRLGIRRDGMVGINAQLDGSGTQYIESTKLGGLDVQIDVDTDERIAGRVRYPKPVDIDGVPTMLDVRFDTPVLTAARGKPLAKDGGAAGKSFLAFAKAVDDSNFNAAFALLSPGMAPQFAKEEWETEEDNASSGIDILRAWGMRKSKVTAAEAFDDHVVLEVEGELFEGMRGLELVRMVQADGAWRYDGGARIGLLRD